MFICIKCAPVDTHWLFNLAMGVSHGPCESCHTTRDCIDYHGSLDQCENKDMDFDVDVDRYDSKEDVTPTPTHTQKETLAQTLDKIKNSGLAIKIIASESKESKEHCAYQSCEDIVVFQMESLCVCQKHAVSLMRCFIPEK
jgi:hypothetical protein